MAADPSSRDDGHGADRQRAASDADAALLVEQRRRAASRLLASGTGAAPPDADEVPLFEARTSAFGGDVDAAGMCLVVLRDRVELRDGEGRVRSVVPIDAIDEVVVRRRLSSSTLRVSGDGGESLVLKGVKPAAASRFRDVVAGTRLARDDGEPSATPTADALRRLDELAAMGLLTASEVADRRSEIARGGR